MGIGVSVSCDLSLYNVSFEYLDLDRSNERFQSIKISTNSITPMPYVRFSLDFVFCG